VFDQFNKDIFLDINKIANQADWLNTVIIIIAEYLPFIFIACLTYLWLSNKKNHRQSSLLAGYAAVFGIGINLFVSLFYFHPRPFMENIGITLINHVPESSFPSDHTTFMLSIAFTLLLLKNTRNIGFILMLMGVVGGLSRVAAGVHYPLDILGSMGVSMSTGVIVVIFKDTFRQTNQLIEDMYSKIFKKKGKI